MNNSIDFDQLAKLAEQVGSVVWHAVLRQMYVEAWVSVGWAVVLSIGLVMGLKALWGRYFQRKLHDKRVDIADYWMVTALLSLPLGIAVGLNVSNAIMLLANPVYAAIRRLAVLL